MPTARLRRIATFASLALLAACQPVDEPATVTAGVAAPFSAEAGGTDLADASCRVALRDVQRPLGAYGYAIEYPDGQPWVVWEAHVDVADDLLAGGATPGLLYSSGWDEAWWEAPAAASVEGAPDGMQRFAFRVTQNGISGNVYGSDWLGVSLDLIPVLHLPGGERLFDHNRNPDPFVNYRLDRGNSYTLADDPDVCWGDAGRPVQVLSAQVASLVGVGNWYRSAQTVLSGIVRTLPTQDPWARVRVHHRVIRQAGTVVRDWSVVEATRVDERTWEFEAPGEQADCPHYCYRMTWEFAVELSADGQTWWDNNGGAGVDHSLTSEFPGAVPTFWSPVASLGSQHAWLSWAHWSPGQPGGGFNGTVILRNLAYDKAVTVVWSSDGWATVNETPASFQSVTLSPELEYWQFAVPVEAPGEAIDFALRYDVGGQTTWDNNMGRDYRLATPADAPADVVGM